MCHHEVEGLWVEDISQDGDGGEDDEKEDI
jgi:hypothetical protein